MDFKPVGKNIRKYRKMRKLRLEDLAEKAGLSNNYVGAIERGEKIPSLDAMIDIVNALDISMDMVFCDVLKTGYETKCSLLADRLNRFTPEQQNCALDVLETLIAHFPYTEK